MARAASAAHRRPLLRAACLVQTPVACRVPPQAERCALSEKVAQRSGIYVVERVGDLARRHLPSAENCRHSPVQITAARNPGSCRPRQSGHQNADFICSLERRGELRLLHHLDSLAKMDEPISRLCCAISVACRKAVRAFHLNCFDFLRIRKVTHVVPTLGRFRPVLVLLAPRLAASLA